MTDTSVKSDETLKFRKHKFELAIMLILAVVVFFISAHFEVLELLYDFSRTHESWQLDEILPTALFLVIAIAIYASRRVRELHKKNIELRQLRSFIPICSSCKNIRTKSGDWKKLEEYMYERSIAEFSHGICPECIEKHYPDYVPTESEKDG